MSKTVDNLNDIDVINDDIKNRIFGGLLFGEGFVSAEKGEGRYQGTPFKSWKIKSECLA